MLFNTMVYWVFFVTVVLVFYALPFRGGKVFLICASLFFYGWWNPAFIFLLMIPTLVDYTTGLLMAGASGRKRRALLLTSVVTNLTVLGFFKYYNFFAANVAQLLGSPERSFLLEIVLPVGISFYTFNALSYIFDIYRGTLTPTRSIVDFCMFIVFFPHLVAGPIVRGADFLPQVVTWKRPAAGFIRSGIDLILVGLVKKMVFADTFALASDRYFRDVAAHPGSVAAWTGTIAFGMQIFFDFSGYTDIARGCARVLGFEFKLNFARPYLATSIGEFWRRWHISLSTWLRDYLYISLGGSRAGRLKTYRNLMLTMVLGGLWHGASWNFVIWGTLHGAALALQRFFKESLARVQGGVHLARGYARPLSALGTFVFVMIAWVFFRAATLQESTQILRNLAAVTDPGQSVLHAGHFALLAAALALALFEEKRNAIGRFFAVSGTPRVAAYGLAFLLLELFGVVDEKIPFVYFQF